MTRRTRQAQARGPGRPRDRHRARPRARRWTRRGRPAGVAGYRRAAEARLKRFRQGSALAVAVTGLLLLLAGPAEVPGQEDLARVRIAGAQVAAEQAASLAQDSPARPAAGLADTAATEAGRSAEEAAGTVRELAVGAYALLPKIAVALAILLLAGLVAWGVKRVLRRALGSWTRAEATSAMVAIAVWLVAIGAALSVVAGEPRALLGSIGLVGLALSWALQTPIESFTGWVLNSFRGYYRLGDRIAVGDVFGDVYRIDFLTTTVWEAGGPDKPVQGAQPTGALITFPNAEVLRSNIVNYTRNFPYVWDEVTVGVSSDSDLGYTMRVFRDVALRTVGEAMDAPAARYIEMLRAAGFGWETATEPQVYLSAAESWTDVTVRYLVAARERRRWSTELLLALSEESARPEHRGRIVAGYPRRRVELLRAGPGEPAEG